MTQGLLVILAVSFALGIAIADWARPPIISLMLSSAAFVALGITLSWCGRHKSRWRAPATTLFLCLAMCSAGGAWHIARQTRPPNDIGIWAGRSVSVLAVMQQRSVSQDNRWRGVVRVLGCAGAQATYIPARGLLLVSGPGPMDAGHGALVSFRARIVDLPSASNPGEFDYGRYLQRAGISARAFAFRPPRVIREGYTATGWANRARELISNAIRATMPDDNATLHTQLLMSIIYGIAVAPLPESIEETFRRAGTIHILVVSGAQVTALVGLFLALRKMMRYPAAHPAVLVMAVPLFVYTLMAGWEPSVLRAAVMAAVCVTAGVLALEYDAYTSLAVAALVLLIANTNRLFSIGAQLSFAATFGVIYFIPSTPRGRPGPHWILVGLWSTLGAGLMVAPILAYHFHSLSLVQLPANAIALPTAAVLTVLGFISSVVSPLAAGPFVWLAVGVNWINHQLIDILLSSSYWFASRPWAYQTSISLSGGQVVAYYVILLGGVAVLRSGVWAKRDGNASPTKRAAGDAALRPSWRDWFTREWAITVACVVVALFAVTAAYRSRPLPLRITFLDVGNGDSILVRSPTGRNVLIDGGGAAYKGGTGANQGERVVLPYLLLNGITRLDSVILTHPHRDHVGGLPSVLGEMRVGLLLDPQIPSDVPEYSEMLAIAANRSIATRRAHVGQRLNLGRGAVLEVLWPPRSLVHGTAEDVNNNCVVTKITYGTFSALLTADIEEEAERMLVGSGKPLRSTVLKAPHHGNDTSSSPAFLNAVRPQIVVITCGDNGPKGPPDHVVLDRFSAIGCRVYRTDRDGAVTVLSDGTSYHVRCFRNRA